MNTSLSMVKGLTVLALVVPVASAIVACGGGGVDVPIGKTNAAETAGALVEGDVCPDTKCADEHFACAATGADGGTVSGTPVNLRCVAGPQEGSGVGVCHLTSDGCTPTVSSTATLKEGDVCPADKCANQAVACANASDGTAQVAKNIRCIAGPQVGSGVGSCNLDFDCAP